MEQKEQGMREGQNERRKEGINGGEKGIKGEKREWEEKFGSRVSDTVSWGKSVAVSTGCHVGTLVWYHNTCIAAARLAEGYAIYMSHTAQQTTLFPRHGHSNYLPELGTNYVGNKKQFFSLCWYYWEIRCYNYLHIVFALINFR